jgi:hypothetical protein
MGNAHEQARAMLCMQQQRKLSKGRVCRTTCPRMCIVRHKTEQTAEDVHVRAVDDTELSKFIYVCTPEKCKGVRLTLTEQNRL